MRLIACIRTTAITDHKAYIMACMTVRQQCNDTDVSHSTEYEQRYLKGMCQQSPGNVTFARPRSQNTCLCISACSVGRKVQLILQLTHTAQLVKCTAYHSCYQLRCGSQLYNETHSCSSPQVDNTLLLLPVLDTTTKHYKRHKQQCTAV